jgi:hypothetical protein
MKKNNFNMEDLVAVGFLDKDFLAEDDQMQMGTQDESPEDDHSAQWYYQGRKFGWWKFDDCDSYLIEEAYMASQSVVVIKSNIYVDLSKMIQTGPTGKVRRIVRTSDKTPFNGFQSYGENAWIYNDRKNGWMAFSDLETSLLEEKYSEGFPNVELLDDVYVDLIKMVRYANHMPPVPILKLDGGKLLSCNMVTR